MNGQKSSLVWRRITWLVLAAGFVFGFALIAMLPPFEGIDETAHFSRLQSQIFGAKVPQADSQKEENAPKLTQDVFDYYRHGPMPYHWITFAPLHERDGQGGYITYKEFFEKPALAPKYIHDYREGVVQPGYRPGPEFNWQYQHPPLYYVFVGQAMKSLAGHTSLVTAFFILRLMTWIIAFAGFSIGLLATRIHLLKTKIPQTEMLTAIGAFYPFLAPAFFWEFARLGNDSLCLLLFGISWALLLWYIRSPRSDAWLYLGLVLGLGFLTKALLIPVAAGMIAFVILHAIRVVRKNKTQRKFWWLPTIQMIALTALIGAPNYVMNYLAFKSLGPVVFTQASNTHNSLALLLQNFSFHQLVIGLQGIFYTAVWLAGTWSYMIIDLPLHRALYIFTAIIGISYLWALRKSDRIFRLPLWTILPMLAGLIVHVLVVMIVQDNDNTPGYYLHILSSAIAVIYGLGLIHLMKRRLLWVSFFALFGLIACVDFFSAWAYASAFAGCAIASPDVPPFYVLHAVDALHCGLPLVFQRLAVLAWPVWSLLGFVLTFGLLGLAGAFVCKQKVSVP